MNSRAMDILNRQEQEEQTAYRSKNLLRRMICQDFADCDGLLRLFDLFGDDVVSLFKSADLPYLLREVTVPVRTGNTFSIHKHTLCQIPYFHTHDFYELVYVVQGKCRQEIDSLPEPHILQEKQACLLRPGVVHMISRCGISDLILKFTIPPALLSKTGGSILSNEPDTGTDAATEAAPAAAAGRDASGGRPMNDGPGVYLFQADSSQAEYLISRLMLESCCRSSFWESAVEHCLSLLFIALARGPEYSSSELLSRLAEYFNLDPCSAALNGFASFIGYSEHHTARLLKRYTGRSFTEQIVALKMERARELLSSSDAAVADIAAELGYASPSGFHKQFLSATGMTPSEYRKLFRAGNGPLRK